MIVHIVRRDDWVAARSGGVYEPPSLEREGSIHFSLEPFEGEEGFELPVELGV